MLNNFTTAPSRRPAVRELKTGPGYEVKALIQNGKAALTAHRARFAIWRGPEL
jgi:hypothetical protein